MRAMPQEPAGEGRDPVIGLAAAARRLTRPLALIAAAAAALLVARYAAVLDLPLSFYVILLAVAAGVGLAGRWISSPTMKFLPWLFALALALRLLSSLTFEISGRPYGDDFSASPDGWKYHVWGRYAGEALLEGTDAHLSRFDRVGSWEVGFYYILGSWYLATGPDPSLGRLLVCIFAALAVLAFHRLARELVAPDLADLAAFAYALWPSSIVWSGYSILRDSLVWLLLMLAVALGIRTLRGSWKAVVPLVAVGFLLRFVRAYAWFFAGLGLFGFVGAAALLPRYRKEWRSHARAVSVTAAVFLAVELFVYMAGFPGPIARLQAYDLGRFVLKAVPTAQPPKEFVARDVSLPKTAPSPAAWAPPPPAAVPEEEEPLHLQPAAGIAGNVVRFVLGPFPWTFDVPGLSYWLLPPVFFWYAILPLIGIGFVLAVREPLSVRALLAVVLAATLVLVLMGRGDAYRHREMLMPGYILAALVGLRHALQRRRLLAVVYGAFILLAGIGMVYHRGTLRDRGLISSLEASRVRATLPTHNAPSPDRSATARRPS